MNNNASITIRTNQEVKNEAQSIFSALGIDMSTAINIFLRQAIQENGLPFKVIINETKGATLKALEEASNNVNMVGPFDTVEDLMNDLDT